MLNPPEPIQAYHPSQYAQPYQSSAKNNGLAIASMVLGILWIWWIGSILAVIFGHIARRQIRNSQGRETGGGMAMTGLVLGWIGVGVLVAVLVLFIVGAATSGTSPSS
jgi:hypothetical protein